MTDPIVCIECGAMSYNDPGKTPIRCATCWESLKAELAELKELYRWRKYPDETPEINRVYQVINSEDDYRFDYFDEFGWLSDCDVLYFRPDDHPKPEADND